MSSRKILILLLLGLGFWLLATGYIRWVPGPFTNDVRGLISFATTLPAAWLSVFATRKIAGLSPEQVLAGACVVVGSALMVDALALRWIPEVYGVDAITARNAAAWLMWGYGASIFWAIFVGARLSRNS